MRRLLNLVEYEMEQQIHERDKRISEERGKSE